MSKIILRKNIKNLNVPTLSSFQNNLSTQKINCDPSSTVLNKACGSLTIEWLNSENAAKYLCISVQTLLNLTSTSQIPYYKFGRLNRYRKDELDICLLQNKRGRHGH